MYVNMVVTNCDDKLIEYEWETLSKFMELMESDSVTIETPIPMLHDLINTFDYNGTDMEIHWNEENLHERGISTVDDFYIWLCSEECDWFD